MFANFYSKMVVNVLRWVNAVGPANFSGPLQKQSGSDNKSGIAVGSKFC